MTFDSHQSRSHMRQFYCNGVHKTIHTSSSKAYGIEPHQTHVRLIADDRCIKGSSGMYKSKRCESCCVNAVLDSEVSGWRGEAKHTAMDDMVTATRGRSFEAWSSAGESVFFPRPVLQTLKTMPCRRDRCPHWLSSGCIPRLMWAWLVYAPDRRPICYPLARGLSASVPRQCPTLNCATSILSSFKLEHLL